MPSKAARRRVVYAVTTLALILLVGLALDPQTLAGEVGTAHRPRHHLAAGFRNLSADYDYSIAQRARGLFRRHRPRLVTGLSVLPNDGTEIRANGQSPTATWIGHSTFLVQLDGVNVLTDPHWGDRTSPVRFAGPRRLIPPGIRFDDLPGIDAVLISHDHYDHLDEDTVRRLAREHRPRFFVPLGIGDCLHARASVP